MRANVDACSINKEKDGGRPFKIMGSTLHPLCPNESELLAFYERGLSGWRRAQIEKHLGECEPCRQSMAMMVCLGRPSGIDSVEESGLIGEDSVRAQLARIMARVAEDEVRRDQARHSGRLGGYVAGRPRVRLAAPLSNRVMLAAAALVFILLAVPVAFWMLSRPSVGQQAMQSLAAAVKTGRNSEAIVSRLPYSEDTTTRGGSDRDDLMFQRALSKVEFASDPSAPTEAKRALASVWLARNQGNDAQNALKILNEIISRGNVTPDLLNDVGVAQFESDRFDEAIESFNRALQLSPSFQYALFNRAVSERTQGRYAEAARSFEQFLETNPSGDWRSEAERRLRGVKDLLGR